MNKVLLFTILAVFLTWPCAGVNAAEPAKVEFSADVKSYINELAAENAPHRTASISALGVIDNKEDTAVFSYKIIYGGKAIEGISQDLTNMDTMSSYEVKVIEKKSLVRITLNNAQEYQVGSLPISDQTAAYRRNAQYFLDNIKDIYGQYELEIQGIEKDTCEQCDYPGSKTSGIYLRYRRIFDGRMVRGDTSYIRIKLYPDGVIQYAEIKWPTFERTTAYETPDYLGTSMKAVDALMSFPSIPYRYDGKNDAGTANRPVNVMIEGMGKSWYKVQISEEEYIVPSFTYMSRIVFEDGTVVPNIMDLPSSSDITMFPQGGVL